MNSTDKLIIIQLGFFVWMVGMFYYQYYLEETNGMILYGLISLILWIGLVGIGTRR